MPVTVKDILDLIEAIAPTDMAEEWDNPGLQVGSHSQEVQKVFLSLDPTLQALNEASNRGAQLLLTHHPLIFNPPSQIIWDAYPGNVIYEASKTGISIASAHTNLDVAEGGINDILARLFHLREIKTLSPIRRKEGIEPGLGRIGNLPEPSTLSDMQIKVKELMGTEPVRTVGNKNTVIRRVALVGGSGGGMISTASANDADLLITGDISHHDALEASSRGMALIDGGHFHTEKTAFTVFADHLKGLFADQGWDVSIENYRQEQSPIQP
jgi:dinuclear metal center YbgI/SA1388 family protein